MTTLCAKHMPARITRLMLAAIAAALAIGSHPDAHAQAAPAPAFEVASVRMVDAHSADDLNRGIGLFSVSPYGTNTLTIRNATLHMLITVAYDIDSRHVTGGPAWLDSQLYDVNAKAEGDAGLTHEQTLPLLQHLLQQRFHLVVHPEKKELPGYVLVVAKGGPKLQATKGGPQSAFSFSNGLRVQDQSVSFFASALAYPIGHPVIDKTEIAGSYDFKLSFAPENANDSTLPSIFTAVQEQFGLKLEPQKVPVEILVIDHADKIPTEN